MLNKVSSEGIIRDLNDTDTVKLAGIIKDSVVDGPGCRYVIFAQGCKHHCKGCQNPQTWDINGGTEIKISELISDILENCPTKKVTFSGGDPLFQCDAFCKIARILKLEGFNIVMYTGFKFEELIGLEILNYVDTVIDGKFEEDKRTVELPFRGSYNQRMIDVKEYLRNYS